MAPWLVPSDPAAVTPTLLCGPLTVPHMHTSLLVGTIHVVHMEPQVKLLLGEAVGGLHTMVDEHFGIGIVQYMAAGASLLISQS